MELEGEIMENEQIIADLHCHTKISDGSTGIDELVMLAKQQGLSAIAVTDHDTFAGATRAKIFGDRRGVEVFPGAEFSAYDRERDRKAHILCYCCAYPDRLEGLCKKIGDSRRRAANIMLQKLMRIYPIPAEMVLRRAQGSTNIYKQHMMHALMDAGYADSIFGPVFQKLFHPRCGLAYSPVSYPEVHDVIAQIHAAGGLAVLAHPAHYNSYDLLQELVDKKLLDGIEVWHASANEQDTADFLALAQENGLLTTGGTDFHGMYKGTPAPLGSYTTPQPALEVLRKKQRQQHAK